MNETIKMVIVLVIICILSAISLSLTYDQTNPIIEERKQEELQKSLNEVFPAKDFKEIEVTKELSEKNVKRMFETKNGLILLIEQPGFQNNIKVLVGISTFRKEITKIKILEHLETPGLGARIEEAGFLVQFKNKLLNKIEADAITGATISSTAVIDAVKETADEVLKSLNEKEPIKNESINNKSIVKK